MRKYRNIWYLTVLCSLLALLCPVSTTLAEDVTTGGNTANGNALTASSAAASSPAETGSVTKAVSEALAGANSIRVTKAGESNEVYYVENSPLFPDTPHRGVAIALGGGGARALVNVGVLKALEEAQIPIDMVVGTSMGAIVAVLYGSGIPVDQIEELVTKIYLPSMFNLNFPFIKSVLNTQEINHYIEKVAPAKEMQNFPIPTALLSYDLNKGVNYIATTGKIGEVIEGPYAIPLCFPGEKHGEYFLIDAGLFELTPALAARALGADVVISTTAYDALPYTTYNSSIRSWVRLINIVKENNAVKIVGKYSDVVIAHDVGEYSFMDFQLAQQFIDLGYQEAQKQIPAIKAILAERNIPLRAPKHEANLNMAALMDDVKYNRTVLDPLIIKPIFYLGKDHSLFNQAMFRSDLYLPQYGLEVNRGKFNGILLSQGKPQDELEARIRWKKLTSQLDLFSLWRMHDQKQSWEAGLAYYGGNYVLNGSVGQIEGARAVHVKSTHDVTLDNLRLQGEDDLLTYSSTNEIPGRSEFVLSEQADYQLNQILSLNPKVVWSNALRLNTPSIYRGVSGGDFAPLQASLELVYKQKFAYSLEIATLFQLTDVEFHEFADYQYDKNGKSAAAIGTGVAVNVNILGIKPSRVGGYVSYEPGQGPRLGLDLNFTF